MNNEVQEISIGQLFGVLKKNFIKGLIFVIIGVILTTSILLCVSAFTSVNSFSSRISYAEAKSGTISFLNSQKSNVMNKALEKVYPDNPERVLEYSQELTNELAISAVIPAKADTDEFIPTSFNISLRPVNKFKISTTEYKNILDAVSQQFAEVLKSNTFESIIFTINVDEELKTSEYIQVADSISDKTDEGLTIIESFINDSKTGKAFKSSKNLTATDILNKMTALRNSINSLKYSIANTKTEITADGIKNYLTFTINSVTAEETKYTKLVAETKFAFENYSATMSQFEQDQTGEKTIIFKGDDFYDKLTGQILYYTNSLYSQTKKKEETQKLLDAVAVADPSKADPIQVKADLIKKSGDLEHLINQYNELITEYSEYRSENNSSYVTSPAKSSLETVISTKVIILANVAIIIVLYMISYGLTYSKLKKQGYFNGNKTEEEKEKE